MQKGVAVGVIVMSEVGFQMLYVHSYDTCPSYHCATPATTVVLATNCIDGRTGVEG